MTSPPLAGYLPPEFLAEALEIATPRLGPEAVTLEAPLLGADALRRLADGLLASRERELAGRPTEALVDALGQTAERWLDRRFAPRCEAEAWLPRVTGYVAATLRAALDTLFESLRAPVLWALIEEELGQRDVLDTFVPRRTLPGRCRA